MKITPLDILRKEFPVKARGLDGEAVGSFLSLVREEMEELLRENARLREEGARREEELKSYREMEDDLRKTVISTHQMAEEHKNSTVKESESLMREAESRRDRILKEAREKAILIHEDIADLRGIKRHLQQEMRLIAEGHLKMLKSYDQVEFITD
jgi:cell division initiation protein